MIVVPSCAAVSVKVAAVAPAILVPLLFHWYDTVAVLGVRAPAVRIWPTVGVPDIAAMAVSGVLISPVGALVAVPL